MFLYFLIRFTLCMEDYELKTVIKIRELIIEDLKKPTSNFFTIKTVDTVYFKFLWNKDGLMYKTYRVNITHELKPFKAREKNVDHTSVALARQIVRNMVKCLTDEKRLFIINDPKSVHDSKFESFRNLLYAELKKDLRNRKGEKIEVTTHLETNKFVYIYSVKHDFLPDKIVFKYPISAYYKKREDLKAYYIQEIPINCDVIKNLKETVPYDYTYSRILNYIRHSIASDIDYWATEDDKGRIYQYYPQSLNFNSCMPLNEKAIEQAIVKNGAIFEGNDFRKTNTYIKYKELYQKFTGQDIKGLILLLYNISRCPSLFKKIIRRITSVPNSVLYSLFTYGNFILSINENFYKKNYPLNLAQVENCHFFFCGNEFRDVSILRPFLVSFYMSCCKVFKSDLSDQIKKMSEDFDKRNLVVLNLEPRDILKEIYKAVDFLTILPHEDYNYFEMNLNNFLYKYQIEVEDEIDKIKQQVREFSIHDEFRHLLIFS